MGETDIVDVTMKTDMTIVSPLLEGLNEIDEINLLGHWLDQGRSAALVDNPDYLTAMTCIASALIAKNPVFQSCATGENFILLTLLREKWPVGSKAKFKIHADRVGAEHTYLAVPCGSVKIKNLSDQNSLKESEAKQLAATLPFFKAHRKRFANSSAVQGLIKQT